MPLFETIPIDLDHVRRLLDEHWGLELGKCLKSSQNHTFLAHSEDLKHCPRIVRVTPDPHQKRRDSTLVEGEFLAFLHANSLPVCPMIPSRKTGNGVVIVDDLVVSVFPYASGEPVAFTEWRWMTEREHVLALGRWMAQLHVLSRRFAVERPDLIAKARHWTELHDGVLAEVPVDPADAATRSDPSRYGLIHGDVNASNYFWNADTKTPQVFDWDQSQLCWFTYDLSTPIWSVVMMAGAGSPVDRSPVPQANPEQYTEWLVEGYESGDHGVKVDRAELARMVGIRRQLYHRFCHRALSETTPDSEMGSFVRYVVSWLDSEDAKAAQQTASE